LNVSRPLVCYTGMKNRFFNLALTQATKLVGKKARVLQLVARMVNLLHTAQKLKMGTNLKEGLFAFGRLTAAYTKGHYREVSGKTVLKLIAAILYFVNPLDLIPDALVGIGFLDDLAVLTWVHRSARLELDKFKDWEANYEKRSAISTL
jgi:uncharacterized membrane protein YkvA (DUF1232 family)